MENQPHGSELFRHYKNDWGCNYATDSACSELRNSGFPRLRCALMMAPSVRDKRGSRVIAPFPGSKNRKSRQLLANIVLPRSQVN